MQLDMTFVIYNVIPAFCKSDITLPNKSASTWIPCTDFNVSKVYPSLGRSSQNTHNVKFNPCYDDGLNNE